VTLKLLELKLGPDHPDTLRTLANLGVNYRDAGRLEEGIERMEEALKRARKQFGRVPAALAWVQVQLFDAYVRAGQFAKAEPIYRESLEQARRQFGSADPRTASAMTALGLNLLNQAKWSEAETSLRECLNVRQAKQPDDWLRFNTMSMLGDALLGQGRHVEAEPPVVQSYEGLKAREAKIPAAGKPRLAEAAERVVRLFEAWNKPDQAAAWKQKLGLADLPADDFTRP
jgi:tetratricopeptide (TPR) repeat protein